LLEEPELSLHPEVVRRLPGMFVAINRNRRQRRQIIVSTHSSDMLSDKGVAPEETLLLTPDANGTLVRSPGRADQEAMRAGLTAADVLIPQTAPQNVEQLLLGLDDDR
jgi:predicted ATPase